MKNVEIAVGPVLIQICRKRALVHNRRGGSGVPHLHVPFEVWAGPAGAAGPQATGVGAFRPHLTFPRTGRRSRHAFLGYIWPEELKALFVALMRDNFDLVFRATEPADLHALGQNNWWVLAIPDEELAAMVKDEKGRLRIRTDERSLERMFETMRRRAIPVSQLSSVSRVPKRTLQMWRLDEDGSPVEWASLTRYPDGPFGPAGWYVTSIPLAEVERFAERAILRWGPQLIRGMIATIEKFGFDSAQTHMTRLLAEAERTAARRFDPSPDEHPLVAQLMRELEPFEFLDGLPGGTVSQK